MVDHSQKIVYQIEQGSRDMVTIIETVCADGTTIRPSVIYQGSKRDAQWGKPNPGNAR
jgi:hypothetical protein